MILARKPRIRITTNSHSPSPVEVIENVVENRSEEITMQPPNRSTRHSCPACGGRVRRSRRNGLVERVFLRVLFIRPYRCLTCDRRFYDKLAFPLRQYNTQRNET